MRKFVTEIMSYFSRCNCNSRMISMVVLVQQPHGSNQHLLPLSIAPKNQKCVIKQMLLAPYSCDQIKSQFLGLSRINCTLFSLENYFCCQPLCLV